MWGQEEWGPAVYDRHMGFAFVIVREHPALALIDEHGSLRIPNVSQMRAAEVNIEGQRASVGALEERAWETIFVVLSRAAGV